MFYSVGCLLFLGATALGAQKVESLYKTMKVNPSTVAVACKSGAKPIVREVETFVIVACKGETVAETK